MSSNEQPEKGFSGSLKKTGRILLAPLKATIRGPKIVRVEKPDEELIDLYAYLQKREEERESHKLIYESKKGEQIEVEVTGHARRRFKKRWAQVFPDNAKLGARHVTLAEWFNRASRINAQGRKYKTRKKRHGKDTLYFSAPPFIFIVQSTQLRTVELGTKDTRHLNKFWLLPQKVDSVETIEVKPSTYTITAWVWNGKAKRSSIHLGVYDPGEADILSLKDCVAFHEEIIELARKKTSKCEVETILVYEGNQEHTPLMIIDL